MASDLHARLVHWLGRHGWLRKAGQGDAEAVDGAPAAMPGATSALAACQEVALGTAGISRLDSRLARWLDRQTGRDSTTEGTARTQAQEEADARRYRRSKGPHAGEAEGFSLHAGVCVGASDREGRERLLRYLARAPQSRAARRTPDGRLLYRLRHAWGPNQTHLILTPLELCARLAALVPPPRHPLLRFHGAFAPASKWRALVVGRAPAASCQRSQPKSACPCPTVEPVEACASLPNGDIPAPSPSAASIGSVAPCHVDVDRAVVAAVTVDPPRATHGEPAPSPRRSPWYIDWATLLRRVHDVDALACPCGGRLFFEEIVTDRAAAREQLTTLGIADSHHDLCGSGHPHLCACRRGHMRSPNELYERVGSYFRPTLLGT